MGDVVIVAYRPKPGCEAALDKLVFEHVPFLRKLGLATDRPATTVRAKDGTVIEVFEWRDGGVEAAHKHPDLARLWAEYAAVCDYIPLRELPECGDLFATFKPAA